jgi:hypothetical protein
MRMRQDVHGYYHMFIQRIHHTCPYQSPFRTDETQWAENTDIHTLFASDHDTDDFAAVSHDNTPPTVTLMGDFAAAAQCRVVGKRPR